MLFLVLGIVLVIGMAGTACEQPAPVATASGAGLVVHDVDGHVVQLAGPARRIVSLFPSATDMLVALGAADHLLARTPFDVDSTLGALPVVGGSVDPSLETLLALAPDVVIAWDAVNDDHVRDRLATTGIPTVSLQTLDTADVFRTIKTLGHLVGRDSTAVALNTKLRVKLAEIRRSIAHRPPRRVFYVAWNNPPMTAGAHTFIGQLIEVAGGRAIFSELKLNWPMVSLEEVVRRQPDVLIIPVGDMQRVSDDELARLPGWRDLTAVQQRRIVRLPVALVNRPGPQIAEAARALRDGLHPEVARSTR